MTRDLLENLLAERILLLDGSMGALIMSRRPTEADYRGERFRSHPIELKNCTDVFCLTQPALIGEIHRQYLDAGADIIETNTFTATPISLAEFQLAEFTYDINKAAAELARAAAEEFTERDPDRPRFVAGSIGPTKISLSLSKDTDDPGRRDATFDEVVASYTEQIRGLVEGGVDILLPETSFDTLTMKACLFAIARFFRERGIELPVMVSGTIFQGGRTLTQQSVEAFWTSVSHFPMLSAGFNCGLGPEQMRPHIERFSEIAPKYISCYPNAGLPNEMGGFDMTPRQMAGFLREFAERGWVNIVGGCCGTTPAHIRAIADAVRDLPPREIPVLPRYSAFSGSERLEIRPESNFIMIGERTNVTGSRRFARLIREDNYDEALSVARQQVESGANMLDVNMDEGLIDSKAAMTRFLNLLAAEPDVAAVPIMIDSSNFEVIEAGLKCVQGKAVVNSISMKEGEAAFLEQARTARAYGAAVVVMAFDEKGQATGCERKVAICKRAYELLTTELGFPPEDIIFDANILTVGTGMEEHANYAV
ncbi:MAG: homocysteine S-methyltransferase family protein, partial [Planctomycetaceae bacterium]